MPAKPASMVPAKRGRSHHSHSLLSFPVVSSDDEPMGHNIPFGWLPMDPATAATLAGNLPPPFSAAAAHGVMYYLDTVPFARQPAVSTAAERAAARQRQEEENAGGVRMVHLLVACAGAIQAGDYSAAQDSLNQARSILVTISTSTGIGRVAKHFVDALAQRLFPAHPQVVLPPPSPTVQANVHNHFYDAGPYLKFAFSTANQAILDAFHGGNCVHIVDLAIMQGLQWPALIHALSQRGGGPPYLRITGVGGTTGDEISEVGHRLRQFARSLDVPFTFREVRVDQLDGLRDWMLGVIPGEALAINSVLQLHRLLVDPDADQGIPAPIDTVLHLVRSLQPRVFTVVEQEADHNRPALLERFANALFHYASMFDSMEAVSGHGGRSVLAEALLRDEIHDVVCGEGSARVERHEPLGRWRERLARAGLAQVPFGPDEARHATAQLIRATMMLPGSGYGIIEHAGALELSWYDRPLYAATAWRATGWDAAAGAVAGTSAVRDMARRRNSRDGSGESNGRGNWAGA